MCLCTSLRPDERGDCVQRDVPKIGLFAVTGKREPKSSPGSPTHPKPSQASFLFRLPGRPHFAYFLEHEPEQALTEGVGFEPTRGVNP